MISGICLSSRNMFGNAGLLPEGHEYAWFAKTMTAPASSLRDLCVLMVCTATLCLGCFGCWRFTLYWQLRLTFAKLPTAQDDEVFVIEVSA